MPEIGAIHPLSDEELWERYGITRTPGDIFHCGPYRYTSLKDAIAQAERENPQRAGAEGRSR